MFTVALIGADGAGKTTIGRRLEHTLPLPVKYVYMGVNLEASNHMLPTTRLIHAIKRARGVAPNAAGPPDPKQARPRPRGVAKRTAAGLKSSLRLVNRLGEEWFRQALAWYYQRRGNIVVFDRHFFPDYYAHDIVNNDMRRSLTRRIHGLMLDRVYPRPDLVICLDAPAEVLFARKGEGTLEALERRRQEYLQMRNVVKHFALVDASQSEEDVARDVTELIWGFYEARVCHNPCLSASFFPYFPFSLLSPPPPCPPAPLREGPTILVTDAHRGSAISIIRSLGRKGWHVITADSDPRSPGFRSRYSREHLLYPPPETAPCEFVVTLLKAARDRGVDLIIPVTDEVILPLSEARAQFEGICELALPEPAALEVVTNKRQTFELAERLNVPVPRTYLVHTVQEAADKAQCLGWPVVLKPQKSRLYREQARIEAFKVCYAENLSELAEQMRRFEGRCPVLLQEYCQGTGYGVELLMHCGRPLAAFQHRRLREIPVTGGVSAFRESVPLDPVLYRYSVQMLEALSWTGLAMVEFKVGGDGPKLMEINGRVWGSLPLAVHSGMDFPSHLAELHLYGPPNGNRALDSHYTIGVRARNLELDLKWIASVMLGRRHYPFLPMPGRQRGVTALLELLNPRYRFDILSLEDPQPGLAVIPNIIRKFGSKVREAT
ncbi:MAG: ATP-grasp domain-containing protein, partial [Anaerolineae bacterium]